MNDERITELFFERSELAIKELDSKYGRILYSISYNILGNKEDAEECVNEAYLGVWNSIPPAKPAHLLSFVCKIAKNISLKRYAKNSAQKRNSIYDVALEELENSLASDTTADNEIELSEITRALESFLDSLSKENRVIFMRRYWFSDSYSDISKRVGLSEKNVSVRLVRIREKLRSYLTERNLL